MRRRVKFQTRITNMYIDLPTGPTMLFSMSLSVLRLLLARFSWDCGLRMITELITTIWEAKRFTLQTFPVPILSSWSKRDILEYYSGIYTWKSDISVFKWGKSLFLVRDNIGFRKSYWTPKNMKFGCSVTSQGNTEANIKLII